MQRTGWIGSLFCCLVLSSTAAAQETRGRPHIIIVMADDAGWDDFSFHGSAQIPTPNLDALAADGIILNNHYVQPMCTPSRSAFLTGLYPMRTGMQHYVIRNSEPWGLPLKFKIMPQYFKGLGYATHAIGKWHLGYFKKEYSPTYRGFDSFYGYHAGYGDYYNHTTERDSHVGLDLFHGTDPIRNATGQYATDLFTDRALSIIKDHNKSQPLFLYLCHMAPHAARPADPFQAPQENIEKFEYIGEKNRTVFAAMLDAMDASVGKVVEALGDRDMLDNTILLFLSDNGGKPWGAQSNRASNFPLRGMKETLWEGGVRGSAFLWSPLIERAPRVSQQMMHITDWLPTLYSAAGGNRRDLGKLDGFNMWRQLSRDLLSPRVEILLNHDNVDKTSALRFSKYKLVKGFQWNDPKSGWFPTPGDTDATVDLDALMKKSTAAEQLRILRDTGKLRYKPGWRKNAAVRCPNLKPIYFSNKGPFLFNVEEDPCEMQDISYTRPRLFKILQERLANYEKETVPPENVPSDPKSFPENHNGVWYYWRGEQ